MSGKTNIDRRALQTRQRIGEAFLKLGGMRAISLISVEGLAREAGIARSTFYSHYQGIDDYISGSFASMLTATADTQSCDRVLPVQAILDHVAIAGKSVPALLEYRHYDKMMRRGEHALRIVAAKRLDKRFPSIAPVERRSIATMLAAGFISMLRDWIEQDRKLPVDEVVRRFEAMEAKLLRAN